MFYIKNNYFKKYIILIHFKIKNIKNIQISKHVLNIVSSHANFSQADKTTNKEPTILVHVISDARESSPLWPPRYMSPLYYTTS
jgi:hypothetical protein